MKSIQFIERDGKPEYAVVPMHLFERIAPLLENMDDEALYDLAKGQDNGFRVPATVVQAIAGGMHSVRAWREHHQLTRAPDRVLPRLHLLQPPAGLRRGAGHAGHL